MKTNVNIIEIVSDRGAAVVARRQFSDPTAAATYVSRYNASVQGRDNPDFYTFAEISN